MVVDEDNVFCSTCGVGITKDQHSEQGGDCSNCELWWELNDPDDEEYYEEHDEDDN